jgi:hypothetical protein
MPRPLAALALALLLAPCEPTGRAAVPEATATPGKVPPLIEEWDIGGPRGVTCWTLRADGKYIGLSCAPSLPGVVRPTRQEPTT